MEVNYARDKNKAKAGSLVNGQGCPQRLRLKEMKGTAFNYWVGCRYNDVDLQARNHSHFIFSPVSLCLSSKIYTKPLNISQNY